MKFLETTFDEYVQSVQVCNLHPNLVKYWDALPSNIRDMCNIIVYGPNGVGKYSQVMYALHKYSPSLLKYEKKISVSVDPDPTLIKISDIHYEVDMSLLGCNSKTIWHEIYQHIVDIISTKPHKCGIIVCTEFHSINAELLDVFFSYIQQYAAETSAISIKWVIISDQYSFIPEGILNQMSVVHVARPTKTIRRRANRMGKLAPTTPTTTATTTTTTTATNTSNLKNPNQCEQYHARVCGEIVRIITDNVKCVHESTCNQPADGPGGKFVPFSYTQLRETLYDILIYRLNITDCLQFILTQLCAEGFITPTNMHDILAQVYRFLKLFNNNYRPIYHLERIILYIIRILCDHDVN